jgi:hypothetical protein
MLTNNNKSEAIYQNFIDMLHNQDTNQINKNLRLCSLYQKFFTRLYNLGEHYLIFIEHNILSIGHIVLFDKIKNNVKDEYNAFISAYPHSFTHNKFIQLEHFEKLKTILDNNNSAYKSFKLDDHYQKCDCNYSNSIKTQCPECNGTGIVKFFGEYSQGQYKMKCKYCSTHGKVYLLNGKPISMSKHKLCDKCFGKGFYFSQYGIILQKDTQEQYVIPSSIIYLLNGLPYITFTDISNSYLLFKYKGGNGLVFISQLYIPEGENYVCI